MHVYEAACSSGSARAGGVLLGASHSTSPHHVLRGTTFLGAAQMFRSSKAPRPAGPSPSEVAKGRSRTSSQAAHPISAFQSRTTTGTHAAMSPGKVSSPRMALCNAEITAPLMLPGSWDSSRRARGG